MKRIGTICPFVPREWIAAHGLQPVRFLPESLDLTPGGYAMAGVCPFVQSMLASISSREDLDLVVLTTTCDQMRRAPDLVTTKNKTPIFLMHVPVVCGTSSVRAFYIAELKRLSGALVRMGGSAPAPRELWDAMARSEGIRNQIRSLREQIPPRRYAEVIARFHEVGEAPTADSGPLASRGGIPVALLGSHRTRSYLDLYGLIEKCGGSVELDATANGERTFPAAFPRESSDRDPLESLADAYFGGIPDAFRRPNDLLYTWLEEKLKERRIQGIILLRPTWCDLWAAETARVRERTGLPVLALDRDTHNFDPRQTTRVEAFLEMFQ
jgi:benzoyl-CoA reductase/2-hydroxyglutaryl-CoA dehydratase subunit BcrC/BadD/HgdB